MLWLNCCPGLFLENVFSKNWLKAKESSLVKGWDLSSHLFLIDSDLFGLLNKPLIFCLGANGLPILDIFHVIYSSFKKHIYSQRYLPLLVYHMSFRQFKLFHINQNFVQLGSWHLLKKSKGLKEIDLLALVSFLGSFEDFSVLISLKISEETWLLSPYCGSSWFIVH